MNTGQIMLSLGAIVLLSFLILRVNSLNIDVQENNINFRLGVVATSFANTYLDLIKSKAFDEVVTDTTISKILISNLTYPLGPELGETLANYDDIDDYNFNGNVLQDTTVLVNPEDPTKKTPLFYTSEVYYVLPNDPNSKSNSRQWFKRIDFKVWAYEMTDTIKLSVVIGY